MIHPHTELRAAAHGGQGVFATRPILRGTVVWTLCEFDRVYSAVEMAALPAAYRSHLEHFAYEDGGRYVLCWDLGRYVNHACEPAMLPAGRDIEIAVRDLKPGDELTCDYGRLNRPPMRCSCGSPACRGLVRNDDPTHTCKQWDPLVKASLALGARVEQPLLAFMRDARDFTDWTAGRRAPPSHADFYSPGRKPFGPENEGD